MALSRRYPLLIPPPGSVYRALAQDIGPGLIARAVETTLVNSLSGYLLALAVAVASVAAAYVNRHIDSFVSALNTFIQSVSVLVWAIVFVMIFGITSRKPPVLVAAAASYPILLSNLYSAARALDDRLRLLARILGATRIQELAYFILPGLVPYMAGASRAAVGVALRISVVAEAFGASGGVGYWLMYSYDYGWREGVFAWALVLVGLMILVDLAVLRPIERWTMKWRLQ